MSSTELKPEELLRARTLLQKLGISDSDDAGIRTFNQYAEMLGQLDPAERSLILDLTGDYLRCQFLQYSALMQKAIATVDPAIFRSVKAAVVLPLAETSKTGKPKSSAVLVYPCRHEVLPAVPDLVGKPLYHFEKLDLLEKGLSKRAATLIMFIDDFIGSGGSAMKQVDRYRASFSRSDDTMLVLALVAQRQGLDFLSSKGVHVAVGTVRTKGISDSISIGNKVAAHQIMDALESRLGVETAYRNGWMGCEALVSMIRTPNNTFPIFWLPKQKNGSPWPAPFVRVA